MTDCKYQMNIQAIGIHCKAYFESIRRDGKAWMHFPVCNESNCPLMHPDLNDLICALNRNCIYEVRVVKTKMIKEKTK